MVLSVSVVRECMNESLDSRPRGRLTVYNLQCDGRMQRSSMSRNGPSSSLHMRASVAATVAVVCAVAVALWLHERKQCAAAAAELAQLRVSFQPTAVAAVLAPALGALSAGFIPSVYELHLSSGTSRAMRCSALEDEAAPWLAYVARLHASLAVPASRWRTLHERSPKLVPRALVAGGGPAGLSAALVAHREGASVTIVEQRTRRSRPVWFDLAPNASAVGGGTSSDPPTTSTQSLLRDWASSS